MSEAEKPGGKKPVMPLPARSAGTVGWAKTKSGSRITTPPSRMARGANAVDQVRRSNLKWSRREGSLNHNETSPAMSAWKRETYVLPRLAARKKAAEFFSRFPKAAYWSEVESWRVLDGDVIEFTMRRLPTAD